MPVSLSARERALSRGGPRTTDAIDDRMISRLLAAQPPAPVSAAARRVSLVIRRPCVGARGQCVSTSRWRRGDAPARPKSTLIRQSSPPRASASATSTAKASSHMPSNEKRRCRFTPSTRARTRPEGPATRSQPGTGRRCPRSPADDHETGDPSAPLLPATAARSGPTTRRTALGGSPDSLPRPSSHFRDRPLWRSCREDIRVDRCTVARLIHQLGLPCAVRSKIKLTTVSDPADLPPKRCP